MEAKHAKYQRLIEHCRTLPATTVAVAHPCDETSLSGAMEAAKLGLIQPLLVGPRAKIEAVAREADARAKVLQDAPMRPAAAMVSASRSDLMVLTHPPWP